MLDRRARTKFLREALKERHDEPFEKALGRIVRHLGGDYAQYVELITEVREYGRAHRTDLRTAARSLADQA